MPEEERAMGVAEMVEDAYLDELADRLERSALRLDGWGGDSRPMVVLVEPCGCKWTSDGKARLSVCTPCLTAAIRRDASR